MKFWDKNFCYEKFIEHENTIRSIESSNEDTTRMRAIDTIIFEVLGWDRTSVETERHVRKIGFADYTFYQNKSSCMIVEAKKSGETFVIPEKNKKKFGDKPVGFALLAKESPEAEEAMIQAAGYASQEGARYIAITNGYQWIMSLSFVQNQPLNKRSVYVFESINSIKERFDSFFRCFSPESIYSNHPASELLESRKAPAPAKISVGINNYPTPAERNVIVNEIGFVISMVWEDINNNDSDIEFLNHCYVNPENQDDVFTLAKELLDQRRKSDDNLTTTPQDTASVPNLIQTYQPERPVVLLGRVGHGKSTFMKYLRLVKAKTTLKKYIQVDINFIDRPAQSHDVENFIFSQIEKSLLSNGIDFTEDSVVRGVLHAELQRFKNSPAGKLFADEPIQYKIKELEFIEKITADRHTYIGKVFNHLKKGRGHSLAIFVDNLDRRPDDIQVEALLRASAMARDWACVIFICLRPSTFYMSKDDGVLDSVAPKTISVVSPKVSVLLKKRFAYAREVASGGVYQNTAAANKEISVKLPNVVDFLECCESSFGKRKDLSEVLEAVSNGNIRDLLRFVNQFITSTHLETGKILKKWRGETSYDIAPHEIIKTLLYGDYLEYDPSKSVFINIFDIKKADPQEHFTRFFILHYLVRVGGASDRGYCQSSHVVEYLSQLGYSIEHANEMIRDLYDEKYCESKIPDVKWDYAGNHIRVTPLGRFHILKLVKSFTYIDAMIVDTPLIGLSNQAILKTPYTIFDRLDRSAIFLSYLDNCADSILDVEAVKLWKTVSGTVNAEIATIRSNPKLR